MFVVDGKRVAGRTEPNKHISCTRIGTYSVRYTCSKALMDVWLGGRVEGRREEARETVEMVVVDRTRQTFQPPAMNATQVEKRNSFAWVHISIHVLTFSDLAGPIHIFEPFQK